MKNVRVPFQPIIMDNFYHCYEFINDEENKNYFYNESILNDIRDIVINKLKMEETTDNDLNIELRQEVLYKKSNFVSSELKPLIHRAFNMVQPRFRVLLWGVFNPFITFKQYMDEYIKEQIIRKGGKITINIPKHGGNIEIDRILSQWILCVDPAKIITNYGYSSMQIIQSEGKSLHQLSTNVSVQCYLL